MIEKLILVDCNDVACGEAEKMEAHRAGLRHRAFSVMIYDAKKRLLLQQRAEHKYHSAGLWANTCCGHPRPGEEIQHAAERRLNEEMGLTCSLQPVGQVAYRLRLENGLYEHEVTHLFAAYWTQEVFVPNPEEVQNTAWQHLADIAEAVQAQPGLYARWFRLYWLKYANSVFRQPIHT